MTFAQNGFTQVDESADFGPGYSDEEVAVLNAEREKQLQLLEHNTELAKEIHQCSLRWLERGKDMTIEEVVHGAVFTALMIQDTAHRKANVELLYEKPKDMLSQIYADLVDNKRTDHFNTVFQNFIQTVN
jgi:hypothetical protein